MIGKFPPRYLKKYILTRIGVEDKDVIMGASIGEDSAIISVDDKYLVIHVDPITGSVEHLGWLAVHIVSNDIAVTGARPRWLLPVYMFPPSTPEKFIDEVTRQVDKAAKELGAMVIGGHSEFTSGLTRPIVSMTGAGFVYKDNLVTTSGAKIGDAIIMTKHVALEGTMILASDFRDILSEKGVSNKILDQSLKYSRDISVVKEALLLSENGLVTSMHDPTEGGIIGGLTEMAYASRKTLVVYEDRLNVKDDTLLYSNLLGIDYLKLISSGVLLATVRKEYVSDAITILRRNGIDASVIGFVDENKGFLVEFHRKDGELVKYYDLVVTDELMKLWSKLKKSI